MSTNVKHLGIIPDGARRWARQNNKTFEDAYMNAMEKLATIIDSAFDAGVVIQSIYGLSKENLERPSSDLNAVFKAEKYAFDVLLPKVCNKWECLVHIAGMIDLLPSDFRQSIERLVNDTKAFKKSGRKLYMLVAYNPWDEITQAIRISPKPEEFRESLWVKEPLDLIIRTGSGQLISNFLPLQAGYAELLFWDKYFNDVDEKEVLAAISQFPVYGARLQGK